MGRLVLKQNPQVVVNSLSQGVGCVLADVVGWFFVEYPHWINWSVVSDKLYDPFANIFPTDFLLLRLFTEGQS